MAVPAIKFTDANGANINIGPCRVYWNNTSLGLTKGGVEFEGVMDTQKISISNFRRHDEYGLYVKDHYVKVTVPLVETTARSIGIINWQSAVNRQVPVGNTTQSQSNVYSAVGKNLLTETTYAPLYIFPSFRLEQNDMQTRVIIYRSTPIGSFKGSYNNQEQIWSVEFLGFPRADGLLYTVG